MTDMATAEAQAIRYDDYLRLLAETGAEPQWGCWQTHRKQLLEQNGEHVTGRLTKAEARQFWLDRFTLDEIHHMAGAFEDAA